MYHKQEEQKEANIQELQGIQDYEEEKKNPQKLIATEVMKKFMRNYKKKKKDQSYGENAKKSYIWIKIWKPFFSYWFQW